VDSLARIRLLWSEEVPIRSAPCGQH